MRYRIALSILLTASVLTACVSPVTVAPSISRLPAAAQSIDVYELAAPESQLYVYRLTITGPALVDELAAALVE